MEYEMKLNATPFQNIKSGKKRVELRLNDEKRRLLKVGDAICFTETKSGEKMWVEVIDLRRFPDFFELYQEYTPVEIGYEEGEKANPEDMYDYYTKEDIAKYGALAICIRRIEEY